MRSLYNFSPGPAALPDAVLERAQAELMNWQGSGLSVHDFGAESRCSQRQQNAQFCSGGYSRFDRRRR